MKSLNRNENEEKKNSRGFKGFQEISGQSPERKSRKNQGTRGMNQDEDTTIQKLTLEPGMGESFDMNIMKSQDKSS